MDRRSAALTVTPPVHDRRMRSGAVNAWRMLRDRGHLRLVFDRLDDACGGGMIEDRGDHRVISLDDRLDRRARHAVLLHELIHDDRDALFPPGTPQAVVDVVERWIEREAVDLLVPPAALVGFVRARSDVEPVTASDVSDEFEVPHDVAMEAMYRLLQRGAAAS